MENALEQEQEFIVNKLRSCCCTHQKELDALKAQQQQQPKSNVSSPRTTLHDSTPSASPALPTHPSPALR